MAGALLASCVLVPSVFSTRVEAVFAVPKLATLWAVLAVCLALIAAGVLVSGRLPRLQGGVRAADLAVGAFVLLEVAAWVFSTDRQQSLVGERLQYQGLLTTLLYAGYYGLARLVVGGPARLLQLAGAATVGGALVAGYALVQRAGLDPVWEGFLPGGRVFSSIGQSNALAAYLVLVLPIAAALLPSTRGWTRGALIVAVAAMAAAFACTLSRGGALGFLAAAGVAVVGWRPLRGVHRRTIALGAAAAVLAAAGAFAVVEPLRERAELANDSSLSFHLAAWEVAARIALDEPLTGTGQETYPDVFPGWSHRVLSAERAAELDAFRVESPHNVYLGIAAGAGIPALAAYLGLLVAVAVAVLRALRVAAPALRAVLVGVLAGSAGHLVADAFISPETTGTWLFWLFLGATLGALPAGAVKQQTVT